jgi:hypothetical protein
VGHTVCVACEGEGAAGRGGGKNDGMKLNFILTFLKTGGEGSKGVGGV